MKIGKYKLKIVESGYFGLDGGAMFGIIPKPLWQKTNPADESNRVNWLPVIFCLKVKIEK